MVDILADRRTTAAVIVSSPEEMPVAESLELAERLRSETDVHLAAVVVNRVLPELFGRGEEVVFDRLRKPAGVKALTAASASSNEAVTAVLDAAELAVTLRRTRAGHMTRLRAELDPSVPLVYVPYLFTRAHGVRATRALAEALDAEIDD
jgi:anion-transporting  ArsA/GET3 family ATPase